MSTTSGTKAGSASLHVLSGAVDSTPVKNSKGQDLLPRKGQTLNATRNVVKQTVAPYGIKKDSHLDLLKELGLGSEYFLFRREALSVFEPLAKEAPTYFKNKMESTLAEGVSPVAMKGQSAFIGQVNETAVTNYLRILVEDMENLVEKVRKEKNGQETRLPSLIYMIDDHQNNPTSDDSIKPDFCVKFSTFAGKDSQVTHIVGEAKRKASLNEIPKADFEQMADYVWSIWSSQPTRLFVAVFFIHGHRLDILIFTRGHWYRYPVGDLCYSLDPNKLGRLRAQENVLKETFAVLWYFLTLPPEKFGHFCPIAEMPYYITFERNDPNSVEATATVSMGPTSDRSMCLDGRIPHIVRPRGRMTYLFNTKYQGKDAVLKLSWTPVHRLPEGAAYEVLKAEGVSGVPEVYDQGIFCGNSFGYRVEYLILESCGGPLDQYAQEEFRGGMKDDEFYLFILKVAKRVATCLAEAWARGVMHRDISIGNLAVGQDGNVKVIDWGYARILDTILKKYSKLIAKWSYNMELAAGDEKIYDHMTGTPLYMGIGVLLGNMRRSVVEDFESLFYVVLDVVSARQKNEKGKLDPWEFKDVKSLAATRIACLSDKKLYLKAFGVQGIPVYLHTFINQYYRALFFEDNEFIGAKMSLCENYTREFYTDSVPGLIDDEVIQLLIGQQNPNERVNIAISSPDAPQRQTSLNIVTKRKWLQIEGNSEPSALGGAQALDDQGHPTQEGLQSEWQSRTPPNIEQPLMGYSSEMSDSGRGQGMEDIDSPTMADPQQPGELPPTPCVLLEKRLRARKKVKYT